MKGLREAFTLALFQAQVTLIQASKDCMQVLFMLLDIFGKYQNIIQIYQHTLVEQVKKRLVHHALKRGRRVAKPKGHDRELELTIARAERCFKAISFCHGQLVIAVAQIKF